MMQLMLCFRSRFTQVPEWSKGEVLRSSAKAPGFEMCECPSLSSFCFLVRFSCPEKEVAEQKGLIEVWKNAAMLRLQKQSSCTAGQEGMLASVYIHKCNAAACQDKPLHSPPEVRMCSIPGPILVSGLVSGLNHQNFHMLQIKLGWEGAGRGGKGLDQEHVISG